MTSTHDLLEDRLRRDLTAVAASVTGEPATRAARPARTSRKRRWALGIGAVLVPVVVGAGAYLNTGPEYVDQIPVETIITEGSIDGSRWLLVESRRTDEDGDPVRGVELVEERENLLGSEWSTVGEEYGEPRVNGYRRAPYLADPSLYNDGGSAVGDSFVWLWAVHPDVTAVRVTVDGASEDLPVYDHEGAGYAVYEVPKDTGWSAELVIDGEVVPGTLEEHPVREQ